MSDGYKRPDPELMHKLQESIDWDSKEATPDHVLRTQLMDARISKTELEWYASRCIAELEQQLEQPPVGYEPTAETLDRWADEVEFFGHDDLASEIRGLLIYEAPNSTPKYNRAAQQPPVGDAIPHENMCPVCTHKPIANGKTCGSELCEHCYTTGGDGK